jgi:hypothetical protein
MAFTTTRSKTETRTWPRRSAAAAAARTCGDTMPHVAAPAQPLRPSWGATWARAEDGLLLRPQGMRERERENRNERGREKETRGAVEEISGMKGRRFLRAQSVFVGARAEGCP